MSKKITSKKQPLKNLLRKNDTSVRKDKFLKLFHKIPFALIEINNDIIIHSTDSARNLLNIDTRSSKINLSDVIIDIEIFHKKMSEGQKRFTLLSGHNNLIFNHILSFSSENHIFHIENSSADKARQTVIDTSTFNLASFQILIEDSFLGICIIDEKGIIVEWNKALSDIFEVDREMYINRPIWEFEYDFLPARQKNPSGKKRIKDFVINYLNKLEKTILDGDFEREINNKTKYIQNWLFPIQTKSGNFFGRISIDISEKKASEIELLEYKDHLEKLFEKKTLELQQSETRLQLLIQSIPIAYYSYNPKDRKKIWYSEQIETLTGFKPESFSKDPDSWIKRILPEDYKQVKSTFNNLQFGNQRVACEYRWKNARSQEIWILDQAVLIEATEKHPQQIIGCFMDITDRKEAENALIESERNYREIFNNSSDAIAVINPVNGKIEDVNDTMLSMFETSYSTIITDDLNRFSEGNSNYNKDIALKLLNAIQNKGTDIIEWHARTAKGRLFWIEANLKPVIINGSPRILAIIRNIDEKKKTEEKIRYKHDFEKLILEISSRFINIPFDKLDQNIEKAFKEICHFSNTDAGYLFLFNDNNQTVSLRNYWHNRSINFHPDQLVKLPYEAARWYMQKIKTNNIVKIDNVEKLPPSAKRLKSNILNQNIRSLIDVPLLFQNSIIGFLGIAVHTSDRKWLDEEIALLKITGQVFINAIKRKESVMQLLHSEQTHREIYNATSEAIIVHDLKNGKILDVNNAMLQMFGYTYDEAIYVSLEDISSGQDNYTFNQAVKLITQTIKKGPQVVEWHAKRKNGELFWIEVSLKIAEINGQKRVLSVIRDISERKKAAEILRENEEKYRLLIEGQTDLVIKMDVEGHFLFVSPSFLEIFDMKEEELQGNTLIPLIHENDRELTLQSFKKLFNPPFSCYIEQRVTTKKGWRWLAWSYKAIHNEKNEIIEIIGTGRDITYQKDIEEALRRSEARFRSIVQQLSDIVFILDSHFKITYDTPSISNILGYSEAFLIGKDFSELVYPDDKKFIVNKINQIKKKKDHTITVEARVQKSNRKYISAELVFINLLHNTSIKGIVLTLRDISERKILDKKILDAVIKTEEQERERFAKNLHDDLGPLLSSIKMYLGLLKKTDKPEKQDYVITQLNEVVKEAITTTKEVSNDLSPHILTNYGLASAIENFIQKIPSTIKVNFHCSLTTERYSNMIENSFYRIVKELINNSVKHSEANNIDIALEEKGQNLSLSYTDDGKGFDMENYEKGKKTGMGISNIISRAKSLNGNYELNTAINSGFSFHITIPINQPF